MRYPDYLYSSADPFVQSRPVTLWLMLFVFLFSSNVLNAEVLQDTPSFSATNQSLNGPGSSVIQLSFKKDLIDLNGIGQLGGILDAKIDNTVATRQGDLQLLCAAGSFFDVASGGCFECPAGYTHNPLLPATDSNVCTRLSNQTTALLKGAPQFLCPAGEFPDLLSGKCYSCPAGYSHDFTLPADVSGVCFNRLTASMDLQTTIGCDAGEFDGLNGRCLSCPAGYQKDLIGNGCHKDTKTSMGFQRTLGCDAGEFDGLDGNCYTCPAGYNNVLGSCERISSSSMTKQRDINPSCSGGFADGLSGNCYSCDGYTRTAAAVTAGDACELFSYLAKTKVGSRACNTFTRICILDSDWTYSGVTSGGNFGAFEGNDYYVCPAGYSKNGLLSALDSQSCFLRATKSARFIGLQTCPAGELISGSACYDCPAGYNHDITVPFNNNGICKTPLQTASRIFAGTFGKCDIGELAANNACYECPADFQHDTLVSFNNVGICTQTLAATALDAGVFRTCSAGELAANGGCYQCPAGFSHDLTVAFNNTGICVNRLNTVASLGADIGFLCPAGEFIDLATQSCYACPAGQLQDPLKGAGVIGVCYNVDQSLPGATGQPQLLCPLGQFADIITAACYTCPVDYLWNPLVPISQNGVCFNLQVAQGLLNPDFQAGIQADYDFALRWGVSGGVKLDAGSVNIDYQPDVEFEYRQDLAYQGEGEMFVLGTVQKPTTSSLRMSTTVPGIEVFLDTHIDARASLIADIAFPGISELGAFKQERYQLDLVNINTNGEVKPNPDFPLLSAQLNFDAMSLDVLGLNIFSSRPGVYNFQKTVSLIGASDVPKNPADPNAIVPPVELSYVLAEFTLSLPDTSTPVDDSCLSSVQCLLEVNGVFVNPPTGYFGDHASQSVIGSGAADTSIHNMLKSGTRTGLAQGLVNNSGLKISDALKVEIDIDGLTSLVTGVPLGLNWAVKLNLSGQESGASGTETAATRNPLIIDFFNITGNLIDLDAAAFLGIDASFTFKPNLLVVYDFGRSLQVQLEGGVLTPMTTVELPLGQQLRFIHPGGRLNIGTRYTLKNNEFINDSDLMLTPVIEGEILSGQWNFIGKPQDFPDQFAAYSASLDILKAPVKVLDLNLFDNSDRAIFSLSGFSDVVGPTLFIQGTALTDSDSDGMPDAYEILYGLDPFNPADAALTADLDKDGISNIDEYLAGSNPAKDELPPQLSVPVDIQIGAIGRLTPVNLGLATATDNVDGAVIPQASNLGPFASGRHFIVWTATDAAGNSTQALQRLDVLPLANLTPSSVTAEGEQLSVTVTLSGLAPAYPVIIPYEVSGTSGNPADHDAASGELVIEAGTTASFRVNIVKDDISETTETLIITMGTPVNAVKGGASVRNIDIVENNVAPVIRLLARQGGVVTQTGAADAGIIVVTATVTDVNSADTHSYDWSASANSLTDIDTLAGSFSFNPAGLPPGIYILRLAVIDSGNPAEQTLASIPLRLLATAPVLSTTADSDNDGIADADEGLGDADDDGIPDYRDNLNEENLALVTEGENGKVVESETGTKIQLGKVGLALGKAALGISETDLVNAGGSRDIGFSFNSRLFDFKLRGKLPGASYRIVFPLPAAIPANARYRKYFENFGWQNYVINAENGLASARSNNGSCPAVGAAAYTAGLNPGDDCLMLLIQDGGANDADGLADGSVSDPGGIATAENSATPATTPTAGSSTSAGGGGGFPLLALFVLIGLVGFSALAKGGDSTTG